MSPQPSDSEHALNGVGCPALLHNLNDRSLLQLLKVVPACRGRDLPTTFLPGPASRFLQPLADTT